MDKQEILNFLSEKKRVTAPVAAAEDSVDRAEKNYGRIPRLIRMGQKTFQQNSIIIPMFTICGILSMREEPKL